MREPWDDPYWVFKVRWRERSYGGAWFVFRRKLGDLGRVLARETGMLRLVGWLERALTRR